MVSTTEAYGWGLAFALLIAVAIPWFLWGEATVIAGLPLWLWWHIGLMGLASLVFYTFTRRAWGVGVHPGGERR